MPYSLEEVRLAFQRNTLIELLKKVEGSERAVALRRAFMVASTLPTAERTIFRLFDELLEDPRCFTGFGWLLKELLGDDAQKDLPETEETALLEYEPRFLRFDREPPDESLEIKIEEMADKTLFKRFLIYHFQNHCGVASTYISTILRQCYRLELRPKPELLLMVASYINFAPDSGLIMRIIPIT